MNDNPLNASAYGKDELPARGGDWVGTGTPLRQVAQIKRVYRDSDGFIADLIIYRFDGERVGRESINEPYEIDGKLRYGPRTYEPACDLAAWYRIEKPEFPIGLTWNHSGDGQTKTAGYHAAPRPWGRYKRRRRPVIPRVDVETTKPNFDPLLERRARLMAAETLRDIARKLGIPELNERAAALEKEAETF